MRIRVQQRNGDIQTFHITPPFSIVEGADMDRIILSDGTEHFFTKEGYYDGWGKTTFETGENEGKKEPQGGKKN